MLRWILAIPLAAAIAVALFYVMSLMVRQPPDPQPPRPNLEIVITAQRKLPPEFPPPPTDLPDQPDAPDIPPPDKQPLPGGGGSGVPVSPGPVTVDPDGGPGAPITPTIIVAPQYPERCRSRGAEGAVVVMFDVNPDGSVTNARIVESADSCFNQTVLRAVERWKYPPDLSTGEPRVRSGVTERFLFSLEDA